MSGRGEARDVLNVGRQSAGRIARVYHEGCYETEKLPTWQILVESVDGLYGRSGPSDSSDGYPYRNSTLAPVTWEFECNKLLEGVAQK